MSESEEHRAAQRQNVLKLAKIVIGGGVIDCVVLDISPTGVRLSIEVLIKMPETVAIHLRGGAVYNARLRWSNGRELGFEFVGPPVLDVTSAERAWPIYEALREIAPDRVIVRLQEWRYFDDPALTSLARTYEDAYATLLAAMRQRASHANRPSTLP